MAGVIIGFVAFFAYLVTRLTGGEMALLYSDLDASDSGNIVSKLESMAVPYELKANGTQIYVPSDRVLRLRMAMAKDGLPTGGSVGYELFDHADSLGTTNFVQNVNLLRALEGELSRTIASLDDVEAARVHLVLPQRQVFTREKEEASASVVLKLRGIGRFSQEQVLAVQNLIASSVPGLKPGRVTVVDDKGNLLAHPGQDPNQPISGSTAEDMRLAYENRLANSIESLLARSVGPDKVRAEVSADIDFDRVTTSAEIYDPDGQVVRSTQTVEEKSSSADKDAQQSVTVGNNLPNNNQQSTTSGSGSPATSASNNSRTEETVNYEITKTVKNQIKEAGTIKRLSVAVLVDGTYKTGKDGKKIYVPRTPAEMQQLEKLVKSAIGYDQARGDSVELVNMPFAPVANLGENIPEPLFGLTLNDYLRIAELLVLAIVAILVILMVVRPLVARLLESIPKAADATAMLADQTATAGQLPGPAPKIPGPTPAQQEELDQMIDINQVEGRVKASSLKKVGEIIEKHPEETVSIIRTWMFQET